MRYLIIDTWNGQGYTESGIVDDITFKDTTESNARYLALNKVREEFAMRYLPHADDQQVKVTRTENAIHADEGDDQGAIHALKVESNHYGLVIRTDTNYVKLLTADGFIAQYEGTLESLEGDRDERLQFIEEMFEKGNAGAYTDIGYEILYKL